MEQLEEGVYDKNVIATYIHGTLLSKNPDITDYIIQYALEKYEEKVELEPLDDTFEEKCREQLLHISFRENKHQRGNIILRSG